MCRLFANTAKTMQLTYEEREAANKQFKQEGISNGERVRRCAAPLTLPPERSAARL